MTIAYILDGITIHQVGQTYLIGSTPYSSLARAMNDAAKMAKAGR